MPPFQDFELEYYQSQHEHNVELNLADSSVKCLGTTDWLEPDETAELLATGLFYPQVNGTTALRRRIADLYPGAGPDNVLVTVGASQANALVCATLLEPSDEVVVLTPGYRQVWGLALNAGCVVRDLPLDPQSGWRVDLARLDEIVGPKTKLVALVNPNNPTGSILTETEMDRIVAACARVGAWLHADEVYHGTEIGAEAPISFWGRYDRLICTNSLSKAYGLSGLRIGWAVSSPATIEALWRRHEYGVIAAAAPSMTLATIALAPTKRQMLLERQRGLSRAGRDVFAQWLPRQGNRFSVLPSPATSLAFVRYELPIGSYEMAERIRQEASVLVAPGVSMGAEQHLRITLGYEPGKVAEALDRIGAVAAAIARG
ncbi:MAG: aminotransferase class I/II-fold pyridoxal phosphate-dependent enzyme [Alphaproteobacteria bacterium]|jgi:aspartate/methionine/tyrosine aminotransferase|nr:aminotransferase class I/II-fold pyridoxal phosphate-dependent enzyme [Alphaproteobacteria bacterium]